MFCLFFFRKPLQIYPTRLLSQVFYPIMNRINLSESVSQNWCLYQVLMSTYRKNRRSVCSTLHSHVIERELIGSKLWWFINGPLSITEFSTFGTNWIPSRPSSQVCDWVIRVYKLMDRKNLPLVVSKRFLWEFERKRIVFQCKWQTMSWLPTFNKWHRILTF